MTVDTAAVAHSSAHTDGLWAERVVARRSTGPCSRDAAAGMVPVAVGPVFTPDRWAQR